MLTKLTSRKFAIAVIMSIVILFVCEDKDISCICATINAIIYMLSEAIVDKARAVKRTIDDSVLVTKDVKDGEQENENK